MSSKKPARRSPLIKLTRESVDRIAEIAKKRFPQATEKQISTLVNGIIQWAIERLDDDWELAAVKRLENGVKLELVGLEIKDENLLEVTKKVP